MQITILEYNGNEMESGCWGDTVVFGLIFLSKCFPPRIPQVTPHSLYKDPAKSTRIF